MASRTALTTRRSLRALSRGVAACVLALQAVLATAPVWEDSAATRPVAHIDEGGTQHASLHGDGNCGLCALRAHTPMPPTAGVELGDAATGHAVPVGRTTFGAGAQPSGHRSRAPPAAD